MVVFVERVVKVFVLNRIDTDGVGTHLLDHPEPAEIGLLIDRKLRRPLARYAGTHVNALDLKFFVSVAPIHQNPGPLCSYKGGGHLVRTDIDINTFAVIQIITHNVQQDDH